MEDLVLVTKTSIRHNFKSGTTNRSYSNETEIVFSILPRDVIRNKHRKDKNMSPELVKSSEWKSTSSSPRGISHYFR